MNEREILDHFVSGFLDGNSEQFHVIQTRISKYIHHQYYGDDLNKDDIASDIMERLLGNLQNDKFYGDNLKALEVYIYGIAKNTILDRVKKSGRLLYRAEIPEQSDTPSQRIDVKVARKSLSDKILEAMDSNCRELLDLKFRKGLSDQEIADRYQRTKNAISTSISRCLKKARELDILTGKM